MTAPPSPQTHLTSGGGGIGTGVRSAESVHLICTSRGRARINKPLIHNGLRSMEAAGVEPASERPVATGLYMRSRTLGFATGVEERRNRRQLARLNLVGAHRTDAPTSLLNGVRPQPVGWKRRTSRVFMPRVQAASSQLRCFSTGLTSTWRSACIQQSLAPVEAVSPPQGVHYCRCDHLNRSWPPPAGRPRAFDWPLGVRPSNG